jgi:hypothetical protein
MVKVEKGITRQERGSWKEWGKSVMEKRSNVKVWSLRERYGKRINQYSSGEN